MSKIPEITNDQIVARLRMIVSEPESLCKTDLHFIEDAADELERLRKERDEARRKICEIESRGTCDSQRYANLMGWDCFKEETNGK
jgi:hypothetical protein